MILVTTTTTTTAMLLISSITILMIVVAVVDAFQIEKRPIAFVATTPPPKTIVSSSSIDHHRRNDISFLQFDRRHCRHSVLSTKSAKQYTSIATRTVLISATTTTTTSINDIVYDDYDNSQDDTTNRAAVAAAAATNPTMATFPSSSLSLSENQTIGSDDSRSSNNNNNNNNNNVDTTTTFQDCGIVHHSVLYAIEQQHRNWIIPTPIQRLAIPRLLSSLQPEHQRQQQSSEPEESSSSADGASSLRTTTTTTKAVWCEAPTGSGKTACYVLPLLQNLLQTSSLSSTKKHPKQQQKKQTMVRSLILCPTRELVLQIGTVVNDLVYQMTVHQKMNTNSTSRVNTKKDPFRRPIFNVVLLYGGSGSSSSSSNSQQQSPPEMQLSTPSHDPTSAAAVIDILIATPGRLLDMITEENTSSSLSSSSKKIRMYNNNSENDDIDDDDDEYDENDKLLEQQILQAFETTATTTSDTKYKKKRPNRPNNGGRQERRKSSTSSSSDRSLSLHQLQSLQLVDPTTATISSSSHNSNRNTIVLNQLQYFILDEADRLLSNAFEKDMNQIVQHMIVGSSSLSTTALKNTDQTRQSYHNLILPNAWLFSATFPKQIEPNVDRFLQRISPTTTTTTTTMSSCVRISCTNSDRTLQEDTSNTLHRKMERSNSIVSNVPTIQQIGPQSTIVLRTIRLEKRHRTQVLRLLIEQNIKTWDRILVFVGTRYSAEMVSRKLRRYDIRSAELHGKLHQEARVRRLQDLTSGKIRVLIATDVASRGLDIDGLPVVINYDLPRSPADFVHRIGRTGRAGRDGTAVTFVTPDTDAHFQLIEQRYILNQNTNIDGQRHTSYPRETIPGFEPDEELWRVEAESTKYTVPGTVSSTKGLAHDRMYGGIKGRRKSKKDKLRELEQQQQ